MLKLASIVNERKGIIDISLDFSSKPFIIGESKMKRLSLFDE